MKGETHAEATERADAATERADTADARADTADARAQAATDRADAADARADAADGRAGHLEIALDSRGVIGMAMGILMHAEEVGPDGAFAILRQASQNQNRKLHDIAAEIVGRYPERPSDA